MKTILIDDNQDDLNHLEKLLKKISKVQIEATFSSGIEALNWLQDHQVDLIVSDIEMPDLNGIETIKSLENPPAVIFASAHPEFAIQSFAVQPLHFLVKPVTMENLLSALSRIKETAVSMEADFIFVLHNKEYVKIKFSDLQYIQAAENYVQLFTSNGKYLVLTNLTQFMKQIPDAQFMRIHKSVAVNLMKVEKLTSEFVTIGQELLPVGESYREFVMTRFSKQMIKRK